MRASSAICSAFLAFLTACAGGCPGEYEDGPWEAGGGGEGGFGGGGDSGGGEDVPSPRLFVLNATDGVATFQNPAALDGSVAATTRLVAGAETDMYGPRDVVVSPDGDMYVASENDSAIVVFENAKTATGAVKPKRKIFANELESPNGLALDSKRDRLYVIQSMTYEVLVIGDASVASGQVAPLNATLIGDSFTPVDIEYQQSGDRLFIAVQAPLGQSQIHVHDGVRNGLNDFNDGADYFDPPPRVISHDDFGPVLSIFVTEDDVLYVVDGEKGIFVFENASTLSGEPEPTFRTTIESASGLGALAKDVAGTFYVADTSAARIYSFAEAAFTPGTATPTRTFESTDLYVPSRLFVVEP